MKKKTKDFMMSGCVLCFARKTGFYQLSSFLKVNYLEVDAFPYVFYYFIVCKN